VNEPIVKYESIPMPDVIRQLHRKRPGYPRVLPCKKSATHVSERPGADRRRTRALGLPEEARAADGLRALIETLMGTLNYAPLVFATAGFQGGGVERDGASNGLQDRTSLPLNCQALT
jgi:acetoacetate decarboxylase